MIYLARARRHSETNEDGTGWYQHSTAQRSPRHAPHDPFSGGPACRRRGHAAAAQSHLCCAVRDGNGTGAVRTTHLTTTTSEQRTVPAGRDQVSSSDIGNSEYGTSIRSFVHRHHPSFGRLAS